MIMLVIDLVWYHSLDGRAGKNLGVLGRSHRTMHSICELILQRLIVMTNVIADIEPRVTDGKSARRNQAKGCRVRTWPTFAMASSTIHPKP